MTGEAEQKYDAVLLVSFGGPEQPDDVMPFLQHVVRGRPVPQSRLDEVAKHYHAIGGKSPINDCNRDLIAALEKELETQGPKLPVYFGNLHWHPFIEETIPKLRSHGARRVLAFVTSAFGSKPGCRKYLDALDQAVALANEGAREGQQIEVDKIRLFYNHPLFIEAIADRLSEALKLQPGARLAFTAHSIPTQMADTSDYVAQLEDACRLVAEHVGHSEWQLVFQSRSGPPSQPWLEPDVCDHLRALSEIGNKAVILVPIGFLSDHVEVVWDLDREANAVAAELGMEVTRADTVGTHPKFVQMIRELIAERTGEVDKRRALGTRGPSPDRCAVSCCCAPADLQARPGTE